MRRNTASQAKLIMMEYNLVKNRYEFDAEAFRTMAYGFIAAAFFGDFAEYIRVFYGLSGVGVYIVARSLIAP